VAWSKKREGLGGGKFGTEPQKRGNAFRQSLKPEEKQEWGGGGNSWGIVKRKEESKRDWETCVTRNKENTGGKPKIAQKKRKRSKGKGGRKGK